MAWIIIGILFVIHMFVSLALVRMTKPGKCEKCGSKRIKVKDMTKLGTTYECLDCHHTFEN